MRSIQLPMLDQVRVASPCPVSWDDMTGDERVRHCDQCNLKVYNLSDMTRAEAEAFLAEASGKGGRVCAGFWRRSDGKIITRDCPVGLARARAAIARRTSRIAAGFALIFSAVVAMATRRTEEPRLRTLEPFASIARALNPIAPFLGPMAPPTQTWIMGDICMPPIPPQEGQP
jgi:hypothetical protein